MTTDQIETFPPVSRPDRFPPHPRFAPEPVAPSPKAVAPVTLGGALRRYPVVFLLPVVILAAAGAALGLRRHPVYTASTQVQVGTPDIISQSTPGIAAAEVTLASTYSREVSSQFVYNPLARQLGISSATIASRLSSSAVPQSPVFTINATGPSAASAIRLSHAATGALTHVINAIDQGENATGRLLNHYRSAQRNANNLAAQAARLQAQAAARASSTVTTPALVTSPAGSGAASGGTAVSSQSTPASRAAQLSAQVAQLQANTLAAQYANAASGTKGASIQVLNPASSASSDRQTVAQRYGLVGAAAGALLGAALVLLVARIRRRSLSRA